MKIFLFALLATLCTLEIYADEANSDLFIGVNYTRSHIKPDDHSSFEGNMYGVQGMYQYRPLNGIYLGIRSSGRYGSNHGDSGRRDLLDVDVHERIGYTAALSCHRMMLTPYTGFGFRHLSHHLKPKEGLSIKLHYNEFYIPVGFLTEYEITRCFSIGLNGVWMPTVYPTLTINVTNGTRWVLKKTYKNFNVALPLIFHNTKVVGRCLSIVLKPYFELWQDGRTKAKTQFDEPLGLPKNTYTFWGINLDIRYAF